MHLILGSSELVWEGKYEDPLLCKKCDRPVNSMKSGRLKVASWVAEHISDLKGRCIVNHRDRKIIKIFSHSHLTGGSPMG
ncbi:MAG: hypothetical protein GDA56_07795 [Hormoscilla sp. GM7CHS1pb]|nr:hypothetical protein [Hormoscilla sp. GM7CHS1pb]